MGSRVVGVMLACWAMSITQPLAAQKPQRLGSTPVPTAEELAEQRRFIAGVVDPRNTLDLIVGRPRVILLHVTPTRTLLADPQVAELSFLEPNGTQMLILGRRVGTTVLYLWFPDPEKKGQEKIIGYLVRVLPDPEAKARREAAAAALAAEVNRAFPNSRVRLTPVGMTTLLNGQAHDVVDAMKILRVLRR
ncbi:MAG: pilus assembly protein N-terminal domain-containing protein [Gemmataceae bacterium]|nr:pilus assembly protein N-terminal domain-containing protein [Gemmata sp.]MDW8198786.1 pilus assembly protein N-terminal domain-containing protein [Gemmataceae bacterium]